MYNLILNRRTGPDLMCRTLLMDWIAWCIESCLHHEIYWHRRWCSCDGWSESGSPCLLIRCCILQRSPPLDVPRPRCCRTWSIRLLEATRPFRRRVWSPQQPCCNPNSPHQWAASSRPISRQHHALVRRLFFKLITGCLSPEPDQMSVQHVARCWD